MVGGDPSPGAQRLLVLGAGPAQTGLLKAARARGLFVIACDRNPAAPGFAYADRRAIVSTEDEHDVARLAEAERVHGLISPGADWPVAIAARVAARLRLPHPLSPATAALAVSKLRQRERFDEAGVPQPRWSTDPHAIAPPSVVKPADRQGQRGLSLVRRPRELDAALGEALAAGRSGQAIAEELIEGPEVTVNAVSVDEVFHPLTATDRLTAEPPAFGVALAHVWPSEHAVEAAIEVARAAAAALGVENGPTYTQVRLGPDGPRVMELAARLGGGHDAELCEAALGIDLNGLAIAAALGEEVVVPDVRPAGGSVVRFLVPPEGELLVVGGLEEALALEGVLDAVVYRPAGWRFGPFRRGADRAGFVLATGGSREEALARADEAAARITFEVADAEALV